MEAILLLTMLGEKSFSKKSLKTREKYEHLCTQKRPPEKGSLLLLLLRRAVLLRRALLQAG